MRGSPGDPGPGLRLSHRKLRDTFCYVTAPPFGVVLNTAAVQGHYAARAADTSHGTRVRRGHVRSVVYRLGPTLNVKLLALNVGLMLFP